MISSRYQKEGRISYIMTFMCKWLKFTMNKYEIFLYKIHLPPNILSYWLFYLTLNIYFIGKKNWPHSFCVSLTIHKLEIRSCTGDNGLSIPDATIHSVNSTADVLNLMKYGEVNRVVSSTAINNRSSRSHRSVFCSWVILTVSLIRNNLSMTDKMLLKIYQLFCITDICLVCV